MTAPGSGEVEFLPHLCAGTPMGGFGSRTAFIQLDGRFRLEVVSRQKRALLGCQIADTWIGVVTQFRQKRLALFARELAHPREAHALEITKSLLV